MPTLRPVLLVCLLLALGACGTSDAPASTLQVTLPSAVPTVAPASPGDVNTDLGEEPDLTAAPDASAAPDTTEASASADEVLGESQPAAGAGSTAAEPVTLPGFRANWLHSGVIWDIELLSFVWIGSDQTDDSAGADVLDCYAIVGVVSPVGVSSGTVAPPFSHPSFFINVDDNALRSESTLPSECDVHQFADLGYRPITQTTVSQGSTVPFYAGFVVPEGSSIDVITLGDPTRHEAPIYLQPELADRIAEAPPTVIKRAPDELLPLTGTTLSNTIPDTDRQFGGDWTVTLTGMIERPPNDLPGSCYILFGTTTADDLHGRALSELSPSFAAIVDGVPSPELAECDHLEAQEAGYADIHTIRVVEGGTAPFYQRFFIPVGADEIVISTAPLDQSPIQFRPDLVDEITSPALPRVELQQLPLEDVAESLFQMKVFDALWAMEVQGVVRVPGADIGNPSNDTGCLVAVGSATLIDVSDGEPINTLDVPEFFVVSNGRVVRSAFGQWCDNSGLVAAGFSALADASETVAVGTRYAFFDVLPLNGDEPLDAIGASIDPFNDQLFRPVLLDEIPQP